jgi:hypothetical protein
VTQLLLLILLLLFLQQQQQDQNHTCSKTLAFRLCLCTMTLLPGKRPAAPELCSCTRSVPCLMDPLSDVSDVGVGFHAHHFSTACVSSNVLGFSAAGWHADMLGSGTLLQRVGTAAVATQIHTIACVCCLTARVYVCMYACKSINLTLLVQEWLCQTFTHSIPLAATLSTSGL